MMKKHNDEGFALAYVVVVIFILCSIAIALMSSTLRTLQAQENMVQRMKDKYEAMGEIERLVAELEYDCENNLSSACANHNTETATIEQAKVDFVDHVSNLISQYNNSSNWNFDTLVLDDPRPAEEISNTEALGFDYSLIVKSEVDGTLVSAKIQLNLSDSAFDITSQEHDHKTSEYEEWEENGGSLSCIPEPATKYYSDFSYEVINVTFDFVSYEVSHSEGGDSDA